MKWLWPSVESLESAHMVTRRAFWFVLVIAAITAGATLLFSVLAPNASRNSAEVQAQMSVRADPWNYLDAALFGLIAIGLYRHSRIAAVAGLALFVAGSLVMWSETGIPSGQIFVVRVILALALIGGVRGTFAYHRMKRAHTQNPASDARVLEPDRGGD